MDYEAFGRHSSDRAEDQKSCSLYIYPDGEKK